MILSDWSLFQLWNERLIDYDHLETLVFNPVEHLASSESLSINSSLDPDLNVYACSQTNSNYIVEDEINGLTDAKQFNSSFSLNKPFSAIGVSETWLNDLTCDSVNISGYIISFPNIGQYLQYF